MASALPTTKDDGREGQRSSSAVPAASGQAVRVEAAHRALLTDSTDRIQPFLKAARRWALVAFEGAGKSDAADRLAVGTYVASVLVSRAAEGELDAAEATTALETLADVREEPLEAARFDLHRTACSSPLLIELPPLVACEIQLRLLILLGVATEASLWRPEGGHIEPLLTLGEGAESRRARATAKAALRRGGTLSLLGPRTLRAALVRRFRAPAAAIVARVSEPVAQADAYLRQLRLRSRRSTSGSSCWSAPRNASVSSSAPASSASCGSASTSTTAPSRTSSLWAARCPCSATRSLRSFRRRIASGRPAASTTSSRASRSSTVICVRSLTHSSREASSAGR